MKVYFRNQVFDVIATPSTTLGELKKIMSSVSKLAPSRQSFKTKTDDPATAVRLGGDASKPLSALGVNPSTTSLVLSDLGPQVGYRTVFLVEYAGPIAIMALYALRPSFVYGASASAAPWSPVALVCVALWLAHFLKREAETLWVHKFSRPTMPLPLLFKNSVYYWFFALVVGYPLCHPSYTPPDSSSQVAVGVALFLAAELVNGAVHLQLSGLRAAEGSDARPVPGGPLFALVSCPNYTAEVLTWVGWSLASQVGAAYAFTVVGGLQMASWALAKHEKYCKDDPGYARTGKKAIIPWVL